jgi:hypothetical protein
MFMLAKRQLATARGRSIKARSLDDPDTLSGASFLDIDALAARRGWRVAPYARLTRGGVRYPQPIPLAGNPTLK